MRAVHSHGVVLSLAILLVSALVPLAAFAAGEDELVGLINARRAEPLGCSGQREAPLGPLAPSRLLASVDAASAGNDLGKALEDAGYRASTASTIALSGVADAAAALRLIEQQHCDVLRNRRFAEIGVAHHGTNWRINVAAPLLSPDLGDWRAAGRAVLRLVNDARRRGATCGRRTFRAAPPLAWNDRLAAAALAHSRDMAEHDYFNHVDGAGRSVGERAAQQGYRWRLIGENIASGQGSPQQVVAGWLASPGHCANIMAPDFAEMGAAYATDPKAAMDIYWTQVFGTR